MLSLNAMGCNRVDFRVPNRFEYGYGLTVPLVKTLVDDLPDLLMTVDSGISCVAGVGRAVELGCQRGRYGSPPARAEVIPSADAIVNPNCRATPFPARRWQVLA